jgi:hypothetical protein
MSLARGALGALGFVFGMGCRPDATGESPAKGTVVIAPAASTSSSMAIPSLPLSAGPAVAATTPWREATLFPDQQEAAPHRIRLVLDRYHGLHVDAPQRTDLLISDDGRIGLEVWSKDPGGVSIRTFRIDSGKQLEAADVYDDPPCNGERRLCDQRRIKAMIPKGNAILRKHRWVKFRRYEFEPRDYEGDDCEKDLSRKFRLQGYEVEFAAPRLRVVRQKDGVVVTDQDIEWGETVQPGCRHWKDLQIGSVSFEAKWRLIVLNLATCERPSCPSDGWYHFIRLPRNR